MDVTLVNGFKDGTIVGDGDRFADKSLVFKLYERGVDIRDIARLLKLDIETVGKWICDINYIQGANDSIIEDLKGLKRAYRLFCAAYDKGEDTSFIHKGLYDVLECTKVFREKATEFVEYCRASLDLYTSSGWASKPEDAKLLKYTNNCIEIISLFAEGANCEVTPYNLEPWLEYLAWDESKLPIGRIQELAKMIGRFSSKSNNWMYQIEYSTCLISDLYSEGFISRVYGKSMSDKLRSYRIHVSTTVQDPRCKEDISDSCLQTIWDIRTKLPLFKEQCVEKYNMVFRNFFILCISEVHRKDIPHIQRTAWIDIYSAYKLCQIFAVNGYLDALCRLETTPLRKDHLSSLEHWLKTLQKFVTDRREDYLGTFSSGETVCKMTVLRYPKYYLGEIAALLARLESFNITLKGVDNFITTGTYSL